jgi:hypothetical protein
MVSSVFLSFLHNVILVGYCEEENVNVTTKAVLKDVQRVEYMSSYLDALETAVR